MALPVLTYDKNGRARDGRGRFLSAREAQVIGWVRSGQVRTENRGGKTIYRGPDGTLVAARYGEQQEEKRYFIGSGDRYKELVIFGSPLDAGRFSVKGSLSTEVYSQGAARAALDMGFLGEDQYIRHGGKIHYVPPDQAGRLSDLMRLLHDRYVKTFLPFLDSPHMVIPLYETSDGNLWDLDALELADEELWEQFSPDETAEVAEAARGFVSWAFSLAGEFAGTKKTKGNAKKGKKGTNKGKTGKNTRRNSGINKKRARR